MVVQNEPKNAQPKNIIRYSNFALGVKFFQNLYMFILNKLPNKNINPTAKRRGGLYKTLGSKYDKAN